MTEAEWMNGLCRKPPDTRLLEVFGETINGKRCLIATDGRRMAILERPDAPNGVEDHPPADAIEALARLGKKPVPVDLAALKAWAGPVGEGVRDFLPCTTCEGRGFTGEPCDECEGKKTHQCSCGDGHDCQECNATGADSGESCDGCGGAAEVRTAKRYGRVLGKLFNLDLLASLLAGPVGGPAEMAVLGDCLRIRGAGWWLMLMAMSEGYRTETSQPDFEVR